MRLALLEADVNYNVVKAFIDTTRERCLGKEVMASLTPGQQVIKIVHEQMIELLGTRWTDIRLSAVPPSVLMLVGLQGSGKTTTAGKLALKFKEEGKNPGMVPADIYRPAAIEQVIKLGQQIQVDTYMPSKGQNPVNICEESIRWASDNSIDTLIIDTAGRLHINQQLMDELREIKKAASPSEVIFVADAMSGQEAVNVAQSFHDQLGIDSVILTKLDGDARGGAALSIRAVVGVPIKYVGVGEKLDKLEPFHPERMASRILGMGDVLSLIEKAQRTFEEKEARKLERKLREEEFTLEDFRDQLRQIRKMGSIEEILDLIPGMGKIKGMKTFMPKDADIARIEAIINSMTPEERRNYRIIDGSRRRRIAMGSGTTVQEVNKLLKNFSQTRKMLKKMKKGGLKGIARGLLNF